MPTTRADVKPELIVDFDVFDPAITMPVDRMQERGAELAAIGPIMWSTAHGGHWVATSYDTVERILRDPELFSSYPNNLVNAGQGRFLPIELDPPEHTSYRRVLQPLFNPTRMRALELRIRGLVNELIDQFQSDGKCEFIAQFAHELPAQVFLALMGWPLEDTPLFTEATEISMNGRPGDTPEQATESRAEAANQMFEYFANIIHQRRNGALGADDVTSEVMNALIEMDGESRPLTDDETARMFFLLLIAGLHTVQGSLAWAVMHLSRNPEQRAALIADPEKVPNAVEEILRYEAATAPGRRALKDVELGGVSIKEGDQILVLSCTANRDASEFKDPGEFQISRTPNRHLSFGLGPHRCIGSHLARIELRIALEELNRRIPDYALDPTESPIVLPSQVRGFARMPIVFTPGGEA